MVFWAPILHFYQPPTQFPAVLKRICDESYRPLIALLDEFERARATVNINGSLTTMLMDRFPAGSPTTPRPSSWSTSADDLARGVPYPLWNDPSNRIQALLWRHLRVCIELVDAASRVNAPGARAYADIARGLLDQALHSCQFWWASRRPMWDLNMVERGLAEQRAVAINALKAVTMSKADDGCRNTAEDRYAIAEDLSRRVRQHLLAA